MRLTADNKRKVTERIRAGAAEAFRADGYEAVNLDRLMWQADLTRGAFYAHYRSKADLFADILRHEHPLLRMLCERDGRDGSQLRRQMLAIFEAYLDPNNREAVFEGCTLASLTGDATRGNEKVRAGFGDGFKAICAEMARGQNQPPVAYGPALILATGALRTARAMADDTAEAEMLKNVWQAFNALLPEEECTDE